MKPTIGKHLGLRCLLVLPPVLLSSSVAHAQCGALHFDGDDDLCTILDSNGDFDLPTAMTVEAWVRTDTLKAGAGFVTATGANGGSWRLGAAVTQPDTALISISTPNSDSANAQSWIATGFWLHYAATWDGQDMKIYVDGSLITTKTHTSPGSTDPVDQITLGENVIFNLEGTLDEIRIWNVVRTDTEIQQSYNAPLVGNEAGLVGYYKFDEGGGDVIVDSSPMGNDGHLGSQSGADDSDPARIVDGPPFETCDFGTVYCDSNPLNVADISISSDDCTQANIFVGMNGAPAGQFGYLLIGASNGTVTDPPGAVGDLCLIGSTIGRYNKDAALTDGSGGLSTDILNAISGGGGGNIPTIGGNVCSPPGQSWNFQFWHRDGMNPSRFSKALAVTFQ